MMKIKEIIKYVKCNRYGEYHKKEEETYTTVQGNVILVMVD